MLDKSGRNGVIFNLYQRHEYNARGYSIGALGFYDPATGIIFQKPLLLKKLFFQYLRLMKDCFYPYYTSRRARVYATLHKCTACMATVAYHRMQWPMHWSSACIGHCICMQTPSMFVWNDDFMIWCEHLMFMFLFYFIIPDMPKYFRTDLFWFVQDRISDTEGYWSPMKGKPNLRIVRWYGVASSFIR